ncbi:MAG: AzlD domain-containing protein [Actinomycetota bacterium]|nr:AzlD domain-containing protein [Actinomycetota bacterium]MDQ2956556.1 AzlD domain-containing protein [Actinomycetota bacterium]
MTAGTGWLIVVLSGIGCYILKYAGYALPQRLFAHAWLQKLIGLLPIALLSALIVVEALADGSHYDADAARLAGFGVGAFVLWRKGSFLIVVISAAVTAAVIRQL